MKFVTTVTWDDVPHLTQAVKDELWASIPPFQRKARSKGIPQLGSGIVFPIDEETIRCDDFAIPDFWPRGYGMDVGYNATAGAWVAHDRQNDILYIYRVYKNGGFGEGVDAPPIHAVAFKAPGDWVPGLIDPAARGRSQVDGRRLLKIYQDLGLKLNAAQNAVESGIYELWTRLTTGRLRVFRSCTSWFEEFRVYRRNAHGQVVKENDHLMDATRYRVAGDGVSTLVVKPVPEIAAMRAPVPVGSRGRADTNLGWMSR